MRKNFLCLIIIFVLTAYLLTGCSSVPQNNSEALNIISTVFPGYDFAKQIAGDKANVSMLLPAGSESHNYEPSPKDIIRIQKCDLFIYTGGESDAWVDDILESLETPVNTVKMLDVSGAYSHEQEHNHIGHDDYDEHVWTSPVYAGKIAEAIQDALCKIDEKNESFYKDNTISYLHELQDLDDSFRNFFKEKEVTLVFGDRFPLKHFADLYGITYYSAFSGCSSETEPSAAELIKLINVVKQQKISTIFCIEFSNRKVVESIAEATGTKIAQFHTCHNVTEQQFEEGVTYISLMRDNLKVLEEAF